MEQITIITISGSIGSGKTSTANRVAELLGYQRFSAGAVMRQMAADRGISLSELTAQALEDPAIDAAIDDALRAAGATEKLVIDSRLGFHFIPHSFKVYITLPLAIAVDRILLDKQNNPLRLVEHEVSREEVYDAVLFRADSERTRYQELYGVTVDNPDQFDMYISSESLSLEEVAQSIVEQYRLWNDTRA